MQVHNLSSKNNKKKKRIGRGGKKGTYSGKGMKGQKSRKGFSQRATFEGGMSSLVSRTKKTRGKGFKPKTKNQTVNLNILESKFESGDVVDAKSLKAKNLVKNSKDPIKILSDGEFSKKLKFQGILFSKAAKAKIEKAGGEIPKK
jgi:large subunit ribosomal protein L15